MSNILHIDTSMFGENGVSAQLTEQLVSSLLASNEDSMVTYRNLSADPIPHFNAATINAISEGKAELADTLIKELQDADILVLGVPMYNFGIPSELKSWFDHIARAKVTFTYTENGPVGLLENKKVYVVTTRGGIHKDSPTDNQIPFLNTILGFVGLNDVEYIFAEGLNMSGGIREEAIQSAKTRIEELVKAA